MLRIRFQRQGRRKSPFFRVVVAEKSRQVKGRFVEIVGHLNPISKECVLKEDRIKYWVSKGAQPSDSVARLCASKGIKECEKYIPTRITKPSKAELEAKAKAEEEAKAKAEAAAQAKAEEEAKAAEAAKEETAAENQES
ncbi:MAG: 30S ribosomal protein S16 [Candidatus Gracilibacteria bacterium]|jgi:small subunit ribosomal protein S16|nr:30S ribosomal protein S16 [Candidatus Gracilibacteria bacterium]